MHRLLILEGAYRLLQPGESQTLVHAPGINYQSLESIQILKPRTSLRTVFSELV